jgi:hypothetical protein
LGFFNVQFGLLPTDVVPLTPDQRTSVELQVSFSVVNEASWLYKNFKPPRYRNSYGFCQLMSGAYVIDTIQLQHVNQELLFWRDETFGILETVGCYAKGLASALQPPFVLITNTVKARKRVTSLRFRLYAGIEANIGIRWETPVARCGGNLIEPDPKQGQPVAPNNTNANPGARPGEQGDYDPTDASDNDGDYDPNSPLPPPPTPGGGSNFPCWHFSCLATFTRCEGDPVTAPLPDLTNPAITPVWVPQQTNPACSNAKDGIFTYNGATVANPTGVVGDVYFSFY